MGEGSPSFLSFPCHVLWILEYLQLCVLYVYYSAPPTVGVCLCLCLPVLVLGHIITFVLRQGHIGLEACQVDKTSYFWVSWNLCIFASYVSQCWECSIYHCAYLSVCVLGIRTQALMLMRHLPWWLFFRFPCPVLLSIYSLVQTLSTSLSTLREWTSFTKTRTKPNLNAFVGLVLVLVLSWGLPTYPCLSWNSFCRLALTLELQVRLAINLQWFSYFWLPNAEITGLNLYAQPGFHFYKMIILPLGFLKNIWKLWFSLFRMPFEAFPWAASIYSLYL